MPSNEPISVKTEDGYIFHRVSTGKYADNRDEIKADIIWNSFNEMIESFHEEEIRYTIKY